MARALTTFDLTLYTIVFHMATGIPAPKKFKCQKFKTDNKKYFSTDETGLRIADLGLICVAEKIRDDEIDSNTSRAFFSKLLFQKNTTEAQKREPVLSKIAYDGTEKVNDLQNENADMDAVLDAYAEMIADSFYTLSPFDEKYKRIFKAIARWTFFVDMVCDYDDDVKQNQNNSLKTDGVKTISEFFNKNPLFLFNENKKISNELNDSLLAVKDDSTEWNILFKILSHALDTVLPSVLNGNDVRFKYFKELHNIRKGLRDEKKRYAKQEKK